MANAAAPPHHVRTADGLDVETSISADGDVFARFFAGYDKAFVLPNEKEDEDGFRRCFELNFGGAYDRLSAQYGPYSEVCLIARENGRFVGGANFIAIPVDSQIVTANLNYIYVDKDARGGGRFSKLVQGVRETIAALHPRMQVLVFIEQNDPFAMSAEDYARDSEFTGLDQLDRLRIWARRGARVVDFPYAQPPLSADQAPDETLVYSVLGAATDAVSACVLKAHLERFFGVSVLKGSPLTAQAQAQVRTLAKTCAAGVAVRLVDPNPLLGRVQTRADIAALWPTPPRNFREALARA